MAEPATANWNGPEPPHESNPGPGVPPRTVRGRRLPLEHTLEAQQAGAIRTWAITLPVRAEQVTITKQVVVVEEVAVRVQPIEDVAHFEEAVLREELHVEPSGDLPADRVVSPDLDAPTRRL